MDRRTASRPAAAAPGATPHEPAIRRWASAALPIVAAAFVLGVSTVKNGFYAATYAPQRFAGLDIGAAGTAAFVAAGLAAVGLLVVLAGPGPAIVRRHLHRARVPGIPGAWPVARLSVVPAVGADDEEAWEVYAALFALAARKSAERAANAEIEGLAAAVARTMAAGPGTGAGVLDRRLSDLCGDGPAREMLARAEHRLPVFGPDTAPADPADWRRAMLAWRGMVEALRSRDPATAETIARRLVRLRQPAGT